MSLARGGAFCGMIKQDDPTKTEGWRLLVAHADSLRDFSISSALRDDKDRFADLSFEFRGNFLADLSKNLWTKATCAHLIAFARELRIEEKKEALFRAANDGFPPFFRDLSGFFSPHTGASGAMKESLRRIRDFADRLHRRQFLGYTGEPIQDVVHVGIGGSYLGTRMAIEALHAYKKPVNVHYVANVDGRTCRAIMQKLSPERTLFIFSSKSFTTAETLTNAKVLRRWFLSRATQEAQVHHFFAVTAQTAEALRFGVPKENIFSLPQSLSGRFSWGSAVGLPIACALGFEHFEQMLSGAHAMDQHFMQALPEENIPLLMALLSVWYINFLKYPTQAVVCYADCLHLFPEYLQQLVMESNGKFLNAAGRIVGHSTAVPLWGGVGSQGQHTFFQWLYQSRQATFCDFIAYACDASSFADSTRQLLAHSIGQARGLMMQAPPPNQPNLRAFVGNRPSTFLLFRALTPYTLGMLMALYEHKVLAEALLWNLPLYEQGGVAHGKSLPHADMVADLQGGVPPAAKWDASTCGLIRACQRYAEGDAGTGDV